jgi:glutathione peroxidase
MQKGVLMKKWMMLLGVLMTSSLWAGDFYSVKENDISGKEMDLSQFKGKVVLVVNVASQCGYTPQLDGLEGLYKKYKDKNFVILGVPTNDFGGQTPESDEGFKEFCSKTYNVTFPLLQKKTIVGKEKRPLYQFLTQEVDKSLKGDVKWNFEKFLVNKEGKVVERFSSKVAPDDRRVVSKVEGLL